MSCSGSEELDGAAPPRLLCVLVNRYGRTLAAVMATTIVYKIARKYNTNFVVVASSSSAPALAGGPACWRPALPEDQPICV